MFDIVDASGDYYAEEMFMTPTDEPEITPPVDESPVEEVEAPVEQESNEEIVTEEAPTLNPFDSSYFKPGTFESQEDELKWYKERVDVVNQLIDKDSALYKTFAETRRDEIISQLDGEIEGFKIMHEALQTDAKGFLLQYLPEALAEHGINPVMNEDQIGEMVEKDLIKHFGEGYQYRLNHAELTNPRSFTAQVWAKQQSLTREWDIINNRNKELLQSWNDNIVAKRNEQSQQQTQPQYTPEDLDKVFQSQFAQKGYTKEEFNGLIEEAKQRTMTFEDLEKLVRFEDYVKEAYEMGKKEAMQQRYQSAKKEGVEHRINNQASNRPVSQTSVMEDFVSIFGNGGLPYY